MAKGMIGAMNEFMLGGGFLSAFFVLCIAVFALILFTFAAWLVRSAGRWHRSDQQPRLTVKAVVAGKWRVFNYRSSDVSEHAGVHHETDCYVVFQLESGDRMKLSVSGEEYGMMAEGDRGYLAFQETQFLGFEQVDGI